MSAALDRTAQRIAQLLAAAGLSGQLHAHSVEAPGRAISVGGDGLVPLASMAKLPVLLAVARATDDGTLAADQARTVRRRTPGPTGIAAMHDPVRMTVRDLAYLMIAVSDNAAADELLDAVGLDAVDRSLRAIGLTRTRVRAGIATMLDDITADLGTTDPVEVARRLGDPRIVAGLRGLDPARAAAVGTPRELCLLLGSIWRDEAASPAACAEMRRVLGLQVWPHRMAAGFPDDTVRVSGKTGTLLTLRGEAGVVELPNGERFAVAVIVRSATVSSSLPQADAAIGTAARLAVDALAVA